MVIDSIPNPELPSPVGSATVEMRYPLRYPDRPASIEYRWHIDRSHWEAALELLDDEPSLDYLPLLDRATGTLDRWAWCDGYDFGSEERRGALQHFYRLLMPTPVLRKLGLEQVVGTNDEDPTRSSASR
jgi:hypothetical protein